MVKRGSKSGKIRLGERLVDLGLAVDQKQAAALVLAGDVVVGDQRAEHIGQMVSVEIPLRLKQKRGQYVSRAGVKLQGAVADSGTVELFGQATILDVGASTGGFSDFALSVGAAKVVAVDVGTNQLAWSLRQDSRVEVLEKTDIRNLSQEKVGLFDILTVDVSFISLRTIIPALANLAKANARQKNKPLRGFFLIKPQFEVAREMIPKGGVIDDRKSQWQAVLDCKKALNSAGFVHLNVYPSQVMGRSGNLEFFLVGEYVAENADSVPAPAKKRILFLCTGNSCRSQMAEGWCRKIHGESIECYSAGVEQHGLNPYAVRVMAEVGVDLNQQYSKTLGELPELTELPNGGKFHVVYAVCDAAAENCPVIPGARLIRTQFEDPPRLARDLRADGAILEVYRRIRDQIEVFVRAIG